MTSAQTRLVTMFEGHMFDLFGKKLIEELENQGVIFAPIYHSDEEFPEDDQENYAEKLESAIEAGELAWELIHDKNRVIITQSGDVVEKSDGFPDSLLERIMSVVSENTKE